MSEYSDAFLDRIYRMSRMEINPVHPEILSRINIQTGSYNVNIEKDNHPLMQTFENYLIPNQPPLPSMRYINGTIMDSLTKEVLAGVTVSTTGVSTTSNSSGFYSLAVSSGTYPITATYDIRYYTNSSVTVSTVLSAVVVQDIELVKKPMGNITGSVTKA